MLTPDKVEQALAKIQTAYGELLDFGIAARQVGQLPDKAYASMTKLFDRFESGYTAAADQRADAQQEADNLDAYIRIELQTAGLDNEYQDYLEARRQTLDRAPDGTELQLLIEANKIKRGIWDSLQ
jgi:hypothetical protein